MTSNLYQIFIRLNRDERVVISKFGEILLTKGIYVYTGRAQRNLKQRILRHFRKNKVKFWHIDYLSTLNSAKIILVKIFRDQELTECKLVERTMIQFKSQIPIKGFGASDCRTCSSHLIKIESTNLEGCHSYNC
ncbi:MAG: GIY-YIG nuclease family protein [Ignavibacteria bacterium]|nr:GIY-YIG nuclease family protein [Ignavibacteria bacterium]